MPDMKLWLFNVKNAVDEIADEELQRRMWFGAGPEIGTPSEAFNRFFSDAAIKEFLQRPDTGLDHRQLEALRHLMNMMRELSDETPQNIDREIGPSFID